MFSLQAIFARRSIRKYTSDSVKDEDVTKLLQAAMAAPSGGNMKPWHFIVIKDRKTLDALAEHPYVETLAILRFLGTLSERIALLLR